MNTRFFHTSKPRIFAHRGSSGSAPENTLLSFETALEEGANFLEMDVHASRDGHIMVLHDSQLGGTTDASAQVSELTLAEIKQLDAGFCFSPDNGVTFPFRGKGIRIPTLREVAQRFPQVPFNIEIKQSEPPIERAAYALLEETGHAELVLLAAESDHLIERIRRLDPGLPTNFASSEVLDFLQRVHNDQWSDFNPGGRALQIPEEHYGMQILSEGLLKAAHRFGIEVHVWTVNEESDMRRLLEMGVDGIMTDYPQRLARVLHNLRSNKRQDRNAP